MDEGIRFLFRISDCSSAIRNLVLVLYLFGMTGWEAFPDGDGDRRRNCMMRMHWKRKLDILRSNFGLFFRNPQSAIRNLVLVLCLFGIIVWGGCRSSQNDAPGLAPQFSLKDLDGNPMKSDYKGKITLVNFWATWCGPCRMEIPDFVELYKTYKARKVEIVGISLDHGGQKKVRSFVEQAGINYPVGIDEKRQVERAFGGVRAIPTTFIVDQEGRIYKRYEGVRSKAVFENDINALLQRER